MKILFSLLFFSLLHIALGTVIQEKLRNPDYNVVHGEAVQNTGGKEMEY